MASPSNPPSSRSSPAESPPTSSASRTPHPKNADAKSRSHGPATHNRYPTAPSSANGIPQSRPPPLAQFLRLRPYLPRLPSESRRATSLRAPCPPQKNVSPSHTNSSSSNQTSALALSSSPTPPKNTARSKYHLKSPPPPTSTFAIPSPLPNPFAISCAIILGPFFNRLASPKHTAEAASPTSIFGGRSSTIASSTPYFSRMCPASAFRNRSVNV